MMVEREIPPTPNNYALWYAHVAAQDPGFSGELLATFPNATSYSDEKSESLYFEHFVRDYLPQNQEAQTAVAGLLSKLFGVVNRAANGTHDYGDILKEAMATLETSKDEEEINNTLSHLLDKTHAVEDLNREFQSELNQAKQEVEALKAALQDSQKNALIDELTKIGNRRAFDQTIEKQLADSRTSTVLMLMDLDHFKHCNDTYGHVMGDRVLECIGQMLGKLEGPDIRVARYGGEEFALIFTGDQSEAETLAELIRAKVESVRIKNVGATQSLITLSVSIGLAAARGGEMPEELTARADGALYQAKKSGRNRVCVARSEEVYSA